VPKQFAESALPDTFSSNCISPIPEMWRRRTPLEYNFPAFAEVQPKQRYIQK